MQVILTENMPSLGRIGDIVKVKPGYARNYLLPKGLALEASGKNVRELEHHKRILAQKREKYLLEMRSVAEKLNGVKLVFHRKVVEEDKLYGSVNAADILKALEDKGFDLDRKAVTLEQPIKKLGEFPVAVRLEAGLSATVKVCVEAEA